MSDEKMKILFLQTNNPGVVWYRMYQFAQKMSDLGLAHCRMFPDWTPNDVLMKDWENEYKNIMPSLTMMLDWCDIVIFQYIHSAKGLSLVQAMRDLKPTFMEADDNFSQVSYESIAYDSNMPGYAQDIWATRQLIESHGAVTTTEYLKKHYSQWNQNVYVIPNCIDFELWDKYKCHSNERIRIGWIGGDTHQGDLKIVRDVLYEILDKYPKTEVYIVCGNPPTDWKNHDRLKLISKWVPIHEYPKLVKDLSFDIGIVPLRDHVFNRGKSNLKYLEYSACRIPTVASNVEPFKKDFEGFLCNSDEDWMECISKLIEDEDLRLGMGNLAYYSVKDNFNVIGISFQYVNMIEEQLKWRGQTLQAQHQVGMI